MTKLIVNDEKFNQALEYFKTEFTSEHWDEEKYKWIAVKHFQDNWDISATDFYAMFSMATEKAENLLTVQHYYPRGMILEFAKRDPEFVRSMFINLFDETLDLAGRIEKFIFDSEKMRVKYGEGAWGNHYQNANSVSTYLWLRYPEKYYIYKYTIYREVAQFLESSYKPKRSSDVQNIINGFRFYDEICERLNADSKVKDLLHSSLDEFCYDDAGLKTMTIDFGYLISRGKIKTVEQHKNWLYLDYSPKISAEQWVELLKMPEVFTPSSLEIMKRMKDYGGAASCKQLSVKYGESCNFYNSGSSYLAQRVAKVTDCKLLLSDNENAKWWPILYVGRYTDDATNGIFIWKLRDELSQALDKVDLSAVKLYAVEDNSPRIWKVSHGNSCFTSEELKLFEREQVIVVHKDTKAKGTVKTSQGEDFMYRMRQGDYFYLCYGNSIRLLGKIISNDVALNETKKDEWYQRKYEVIAKSLDNTPFKNTVKKWWMPNENSTIIEVKNSDYELFETTILKPYFNMTISELKQEKVMTKNYWWLNASPKIWSFSDIGIGEVVSYTLYNDNGNKRRIFQNFLEAKEGDTIVCYESNPIKKIVALGKVSKGNDGKNIYFEKTEVLANPIDYAELKECPELADMEYFINPNGSLFRLTKEEFEFIMDVVREENPIEIVSLAPYSSDNFLAEVYMPKDEYKTLVNLLKNKKNIILQGAPGVGKTFTAKRLAYSIMGVKDDNRIEFVQFHQNYSYEDFIMGYRPEGAGFELKDGIFYCFCRKAESQPEKDFFFIIDEINRGNLSKIFGELLMLIERNYRGEKITLAYNGLPFNVPKNLYIIGMMNTADRSLAMIDYALRRRFSFFEIEPAFNSNGFIDYKNRIGNEKFNLLIEQIKELNNEITKDSSLGSGFCIGHSYFCEREVYTEDTLREVVEYEIIPMIEEYWFDDKEKLAKWKNNLRGVFND